MYNTTEQAHGAQQFKPNATVAAVIVSKNNQGETCYLLVEEIENNQHVLNQPAGHLEANENLIDACKREVLEETGLNLLPQYASGIYYFHRPELNLYFLRFCFVIELEQCITATPQDDEILACHWLTLPQIKAKKAQLRSAMVLECIEDYELNKSTNSSLNTQIPLAMFKSNL
jgi:phosphatase NudJ